MLLFLLIIDDSNSSPPRHSSDTTSSKSIQLGSQRLSFPTLWPLCPTQSFSFYFHFKRVLISWFKYK